MRNFLNNKLEEIRNSSRGVKMRWMAGMSALAMAIVVALWFFFLNEAPAPLPDEVSAGKWEIFKAGLKAAFNFIKDGASEIISKIFNPRTINIK